MLFSPCILRVLPKQLDSSLRSQFVLQGLDASLTLARSGGLWSREAGWSLPGRLVPLLGKSYTDLHREKAHLTTRFLTEIWFQPGHRESPYDSCWWKSPAEQARYRDTVQ